MKGNQIFEVNCFISGAKVVWALSYLISIVKRLFAEMTSEPEMGRSLWT